MTKEKYVFLRADGITAADPVFQKVFNAFYEAEIPVSYAVVPALADKALASFFRSKQRRELFSVVQYGWKAFNHNSAEGGQPYEFGPVRKAEEQASDMAQGKKAMEALFGDLYFPAFVPPFNMYDRNTQAAADAAGFLFFAAGKPLFPTERFHYKHLTANVNLTHYDPGDPIPLNTLEIIRDTRRGMAARRVAGVFFRVAAFGGASWSPFLHYVDFLKASRANHSCSFLTVKEIDALWPKKSDSLRWIL